MNRLLIFLLSSLTATTNFCMEQSVTIAKGKAKMEAAEAGTAHEALRPVQLIFIDEKHVELPTKLLPVLQTARHSAIGAHTEEEATLHIPYPSQHIDNFIHHVIAFINKQDITSLPSTDSLEENIACLHFAHYLNANKTIFDTYSAEIARKFMLPDTINRFFDDPAIYNIIKTMHFNLQGEVVNQLIDQAPYVLIKKSQNSLRVFKEISLTAEIDNLVATSNSDDITITVSKTSEPQKKTTLEGHKKPITSIVFHPHKKLVLTASYDHTARIWDAQTGECLKVLEGHTSAVNSAKFNNNGTRVITASNDCTTRTWNTDTGQCLHTLKEHTSWAKFAKFDSINEIDDAIVTIYDDGTEYIWRNSLSKYRTYRTAWGQTLTYNLAQTLCILTFHNLKQSKQPIVINRSSHIWKIFSSNEAYSHLAYYDLVRTFDIEWISTKQEPEKKSETRCPNLISFFSACFPWNQERPAATQIQDHKKLA